MALSQSQILSQQQRLSPQQIQFIKLLQMSTLDFEEKLDEELLDNPALEKSDTEMDYSDNTVDLTERKSDDWDSEYQNDIDVEEIMRASGNDDEYSILLIVDTILRNDKRLLLPLLVYKISDKFNIPIFLVKLSSFSFASFAFLVKFFEFII
jgi:DNA-directed RNA polymerase specialized sigma54-like protein